VGIVRPYAAEWDTTPYPPKFKASTLHTFDGKGSPNQHIYYFKSRTGNVISNDAIMARLFIGTLKGFTFQWFMKLPAGSIKTWADLEKFWLVSLKKIQKFQCNSPCSQAKERRVHQNLRREISEHGTPLSQRHDPVSTI